MSQTNKDSKKEKLRAAIQKRVNKEEHAYRLVEKMVLLDSVDKEFFLNAGVYITVSQYKDVTEERAITKLCGYPLCNNRITQELKQKYKISVRQKKVYDITERKNFCSNKCYKSSKYFESQLSTEPVWMKEKTTSPGLKLLDDSDESTKKLSGSGEEVLMSTQKDIDENVHAEGEREDVEYEHAYNDDENEDLVYEHEDVYGEHADIQSEYKDVGCEHESIDDEHEGVVNEHEIVDYKNENVDNQHDDIDDHHEYDIHKHIQFDNNDLGCIVERVADVKIDFDFADSDDDDDIDDDVDDIDNIDDDQCFDQRAEKDADNNEEKIAQNSDSFVHDNLSSSAKKISLSDNERQRRKSKDNEFSNQSKNRTANQHEMEDSKVSSVKYSCDSQCVDQGNTSVDQKYGPTDLPVKNVHTNELEDEEIITKKELVKSEHNHVNSDGRSAFVFGNRSEKEQIRNLSIYKVYQVLLEWRTFETEKFLTKSLESKEDNDRKETEKATGERSKRKDGGKSLLLPSIDSKSQMAIRGKIVCEKLTKAMSPMLSKLRITMADISSQLTSMVKTFRFTNTNIVLKPFEWTLVALILLLVLVRCTPSLKGLLSTRQKDLHSLLSNTVNDEDDVDRLLGVFSFEEVSEPSMIDGQQQFDMEELD